RTTHAFYRQSNGAWFIKKLSEPASAWKYVGGSSVPMSKLRFGDFTGDGVTDVLAVQKGRWAISESARKRWRRINDHLGVPVENLLIANMDRDDNIDDILLFRYDREGGGGEEKLTAWRSKNGVEPWKKFKSY